VVKIQFDVLWVMLCSVAVGYQRFGGPCCLHLHDEVYGAGKVLTVSLLARTGLSALYYLPVEARPVHHLAPLTTAIQASSQSARNPVRSCSPHRSPPTSSITILSCFLLVAGFYPFLYPTSLSMSPSQWCKLNLAISPDRPRCLDLRGGQSWPQCNHCQC
jgi:hypothetical protein